MNKILYITLAFILCFTFFIPVSYAATLADYGLTYSDLPEDVRDGDHIIVVKYPDSDRLYIASVTDIHGYIDSANGEWRCYRKDGSGYGYFVGLYVSNSRYDYERTSYYYDPSTKEFVFDETVTRNFYQVLANGDVLFTTIDIYGLNYGSEADLVFPLAPKPKTELYQIIQEVTNQTLPQTQTTVVGAMRILVLCGVGCLALLMVLPLFGKVLKRYLPR